jgi:GntR family negative regulator for fad regulon and positive regulator of fabA
LNVTRQTVRELLQRLASDRWITIQHGKPTIVNHCWTEGGLGILKTLVNFADYLPREFVTHLLQSRVVFMPACAGTAVADHAEKFLAHLEAAGSLAESPAEYAAFDWKLQSMMAGLSGNMIYPLILNDFAPVFKALGERYFTLPEGRTASAGYYRRLARAIRRKSAVEGIVRKAMEDSLSIWKKFSG